MSDSLGTTQMRLWVHRLQRGDLAARDDLLHTICGRMERLARRMLKDYPGVARVAETDDVLQNALLRLLRALQEIEPGSMREFFRIGALQIRRELLDLARRCRGPESPARNELPMDSQFDAVGGASATPADAVADVDQWSAFHEGVDQLPTEEREVVGLMFYHGWSQTEVAELLHVTERTVRRWWQSARLKLHDRLKAVS